MNKRSPFYLRGLAWLAGGLIFWIFISLHAVMLLDSEAGVSSFGKWDAFFALIFGGPVFLLIRALIRKTRGVYRAGAVFRVFLTLSALLGVLTPVSMILGFIRIGLKSESPSMGGLFFMFISFWGLVGAILCFGCRFLFKPAFPQTESGAERSGKKDFEMEIRTDASASGIRSGPVPQEASPRSSGKPALYALLQTSLDQKLPLGALEAASRAVPAICEADCARMSREAYGIIATKLTDEVSRSFQRALKGQGISAVRMNHEDLFTLPQGRITRDFCFEDGKIIETDSFGRELVLHPEECVFIAGGCVHDRIRSQKSSTIKQKQLRSFGKRVPEVDINVTVVKKDVWESAMMFRMDVFRLKDPYRLIWQCDPSRPSRLNGEAVRVGEHPESIRSFMMEMSRWLSDGQTNRGLKWLGGPEVFTYPSLSAFEEEIIWSLTRRTPSDG